MDNKKEKHSSRIMPLEFVRIVMTGIVFLSHMEFLSNYSYGEIYTRYLHNATIGVDYFFVLSGFGLMAAYRKQKDKSNYCIGGGIRYGLRKIRSVYSPYMISMIVMIPYVFCVSMADNKMGSTVLKTGMKFVLCGTMTQSLSSMLKFAHAFNGAGWFISTIFIIYCATPKMLTFSNTLCKNERKTVVSTVVVIIFAASIRYMLFLVQQKSSLDDISYSFPLARISYVLLGMCIYQLYRWLPRGGQKETYYTVQEIFIVVLTIIWFLLRNSVEGNICRFIIYVLDLVIVGSLVISFARECGKLSEAVSNSVIAKCGKDMMYVYLYHYPIRIYCDLFFQGHRYIWGEFTGLCEVVVIFTLTIVACKMHKCIIRHCDV